jgi:thiol:disulfide interchange protein
MNRYVVDYSERGQREGALLQSHDVRGLPTLIFFNGSGEEAGRIVGGRPAPEVAAVARRALGQ